MVGSRPWWKSKSRTRTQWELSKWKMVDDKSCDGCRKWPHAISGLMFRRYSEETTLSVYAGIQGLRALSQGIEAALASLPRSQLLATTPEMQRGERLVVLPMLPKEYIHWKLPSSFPLPIVVPQVSLFHGPMGERSFFSGRRSTFRASQMHRAAPVNADLRSASGSAPVFPFPRRLP